MRHSTDKMRKIITLATVLLVCIAIVSALQPIPESRVGYATLNEAPATYGTPITVEVYNTGEVVGSTTVQYPDGGYSLDIIFDDPDTPEDEGANEGDQLTWKINGIDCSTPALGTDTATPGGINNNFNLTATSEDNPNSATVIHPNGGESIPLGTQVQVSAHATDDTSVASVTFSYSNNSGSEWNSIGAGTRVSGTDKDGIWNQIWNTSGLGTGSNYLIRAVADNGTSTREDQSDSTFSLTSTPPSSNDNDNGNGGGGGSSSSSSSSGGGSGSSGEDFYNIVISETDRQSIFKNTSVSFIFDLEGNIVKHINFTALNSAGTVAVKVEILNNTSTLVSTPPPYEVYKNLNVWVGNYGWATEKNMADTTVSFTVEKSWITVNNIDETTIALYRYSDDTWHKLVTRKIAEDANSLQFEAETPGFSPFAVTGKELEGEPGGEGIIEPTVTAEKTPIPTPTEKKGIPGFSLFAGLSILLMAVQLLRKKN